MPGVTVAVLGGESALGLALELGKGKAEGDLARTFHKKGDRSLNLLAPTRYPDRVQGVSQALLVADHVVLVADSLDRDLGLLVLAAALVAPEGGTLVVREGVDGSGLRALVKDTPLAAWPVLAGRDGGAALLRERLLEVAVPRPGGAGRVVVEQAFSVRGAGTVALGVVTAGTVRRHEVLVHHPSGKQVTVRSIQVHDDDVSGAGHGDRVGLALRGLEAEALSRGHVLAAEGATRTWQPQEPVRFEWAVPRFQRAGLQADRHHHLGAGLQFVPVTTGKGDSVAPGGTGTVALASASPVVLADAERVLLWDLEDTSLRLVAAGRTVPDASGPGADP